MAKNFVWFGLFEFGDFVKRGFGKSEHPCAVIHRIDAKLMIDEEEIEEHLKEYDSYLIPHEFNGEIFYSEIFYEDLLKSQ